MVVYHSLQKILSSTTVLITDLIINVSWAENQHIRMIFFKDIVKLKSNDAENPALHQITTHSKRKQLF